MRTLVIDTSSPALSVALFDGDHLIAADHRRVGRGHAEQLLPSIAALPDGGRAQALWVGRGPGSFTGTRIGIAAARALAFAWEAELAGFDSLALLAAQVRRVAETDAVGVACTGGHGEWLITQSGVDPQSVVPDRAATMLTATVIGGDCAAELVALRGYGRAIAAEVDAREFAGLDQTERLAVRPHYARAPDAKVSVVAMGSQ